MVEANDRKGILESLWPGEFVASLFSGGQKYGSEDSFPDGDFHDATVERNVGAARTSDSPEQPILTPEEQILKLVTQQGGRMKQAEVVSNVEWSESTVSRKLQKLEAAGDITRYQLGREKLVYLPGHEPDSLKSPLAERDEEAPLAP